MEQRKPVVCLVTPALASANNGNWRTAQRWARHLAADYEVQLMREWSGSPADAMLALHARRSAPSVRAWAAQRPRKPLAVVLTGTDLYLDVRNDDSAQRSLVLADRLVVLNDEGPDAVPGDQREKCVVCLQSSATRRTLEKTTRHLRALMVGHLRAVKDPGTYFAAARLLADRPDIRLDHIGAPLEPALGDQARALAQAQPAYRWLAGLAHRQTLARIQRAHVLVIASVMEGGAQVLIEAVRSGTPVLASRIAGNVGLLGAAYGGYFEPGDAAGLARLLTLCRDDAAMLVALRAQCAARAPLFEPSRERATVRRLLAVLLETER